jgi:hypothetical protein
MKKNKLSDIIGENLLRSLKDFEKSKKINFKDVEPSFSKILKYSDEEDVFFEKHYGKNWFEKYKVLKNEVSDEHLSQLSFTVAKWVYEKSKVSNDYIQASRPHKVLKFIKLFLEQEKKSKYINSFNVTDVLLLSLLSKNISLDVIEKLQSKMDFKMCLEFEKMIGYEEI